jgi:hypothetical protein
MTSKVDAEPLTIYLLHFIPPYKTAGHYLGITPTRRLTIRFAEHGSGRGSKLTAAALSSGSKLIVARLWHGVSYETESLWKRQSHFRDRCPVCAGSLPDPAGWCYPAIVATAPASTGWTATDWRMPAAPGPKASVR